MTDKTYDLKADFGAVGNGVTDDTAAFVSFTSTALSWQSGHPTDRIVLNIPAGTYQFNQTEPNKPLKGIQNVKVVGAGRTLTRINHINNTQAYWGGDLGIVQQGLDEATGISARTTAASKGDTSVQLVDSASFTKSQLAGRFTAGKYAVMTGYAPQGFLGNDFGYPPNWQFYEYLLVTSVDSTNGIIHFTPLNSAGLIYDYKTDWPLISKGAAGAADLGGPATIYALNSDWSVTAEITDLQSNQDTNQTVGSGLDITFRRVDFTGAASTGFYPTQSYRVSCYDCTATGQTMEVDKVIDQVILDNYSTSLLQFQSCSPRLMTLQNGTTLASGTSGCCINLLIQGGCVIPSAQIGVTSYGRNDSVTFLDSEIDTIFIGSVNNKGTVDNQGVNNITWTMSGGVLTIPDAFWDHVQANDNPLRGFAPGTQCFWDHDFLNEGHFSITSVVKSGSNTLVNTTWAGGFPHAAGDGVLGMVTHPAPRFTCTNCTGTDGAYYSSFHTPGKPYNSMAKRTYPMSSGNPVMSQLFIWGAIDTFEYNVTHPYAGAGTLTFHVSEFDNWTYLTDVTNGSTATFAGTVNAKVAGKTTLHKSDFTGDAWFPQQSSSGPQYSSDISGTDPAVSLTVTINTNQGFDFSQQAFNINPARVRWH